MSALLLRRFATRSVFPLMLAAELLLVCGCGTLPEKASSRLPVPVAAGRVYRAPELGRLLPGVVLGNDTYAEVNSAWLTMWYLTYRRELFRLGVVRWDMRFDCNRYATFYSGMAQAFFFAEAFQQKTPAVALALGPFWYVRDHDKSGHAVIQAVTERGRIFIDPQTGQEVSLSAPELASAYLQYF